MVFTKGNIPWNKGKKVGPYPKEFKEKMRQMRLGKKGESSIGWKGGRRKGGKFWYIRIYCPSHPHCDDKGYILEHRLVMEKHIGRILLLTEIVHHIDGDKQNNRIENLMLFKDNREHIGFSHSGKYSKNYTKGKKICIDCGNLTKSYTAKRCWKCYLIVTHGEQN